MLAESLQSTVQDQWQQVKIVFLMFLSLIVCVVAFDRVEIRHPILHLDLVKLEAQVVAVGKSSMVYI